MNDARFALGIVRKAPFSVLVQVTNRCNLECSFCDFWANGATPKQELSLGELGRVAAELAGIGTFLVSIEGGEPFVRPDLVEIVRIFAERHLPLVYTNGWFVDREKAAALFAAGVVQVGVSIDFPDAERHDAKRGRAGTWERAWRAVEVLRDAAPHGGRQVHVMTVLMQANQGDLDALLAMSAERGVGHQVTLLSTGGFRRGTADALPASGLGATLAAAWKRWPHFRAMRDYLDGIDPYLIGDEAGLPGCRAGVQSFNIDHVGNVSPCIEKIDASVGNVREAGIGELWRRLVAADAGRGCQQCWTLCRGIAQGLGDGGGRRSIMDLAVRMRSR